MRELIVIPLLILMASCTASQITSPKKHFNVDAFPGLVQMASDNKGIVLDYELDDVFTPERQDLNQLYPFTLVQAQGYRVKLTDQGTSTEYVREKVGSFSQFFRFSDFAGIPFSTVFDAQAAHAVNVPANGGVLQLWSDYGPSCEMGLGGVTQTQLNPIYCTGGQDFELGDIVQAEIVPDGGPYRFTFFDGVDTHVRQKPSYGVFLYDVPGLEYGKTYQVTVEVRVNGVWSPPGSVCAINMLTQPTREIINDSLGGREIAATW